MVWQSFAEWKATKAPIANLPMEMLVKIANVMDTSEEVHNFRLASKEMHDAAAEAFGRSFNKKIFHCSISSLHALSLLASKSECKWVQELTVSCAHYSLERPDEEWAAEKLAEAMKAMPRLEEVTIVGGLGGPVAGKTIYRPDIEYDKAALDEENQSLEIMADMDSLDRQFSEDSDDEEDGVTLPLAQDIPRFTFDYFKRAFQQMDCSRITKLRILDISAYDLPSVMIVKDDAKIPLLPTAKELELRISEIEYPLTDRMPCFLAGFPSLESFKLTLPTLEKYQDLGRRAAWTITNAAATFFGLVEYTSGQWVDEYVELRCLTDVEVNNAPASMESSWEDFKKRHSGLRWTKAEWIPVD